MTTQTYTLSPGLDFLRAIVALDDAEVERLRREVDPEVMRDSLTSVTVWLGVEAFGPHLLQVLDSMLLDLQLDPVTLPAEGNPE